MKVIVDTSVWSLALRRSKDGENEYVEELRDLFSVLVFSIYDPVNFVFPNS